MQKFFARENNLTIYLVLLAVLGMGLVYYTTSPFGPGVSGDSVRYLSVAQNLAAGLGFYDYSLAPLLAWPPLYSILLALISLLTRDVFIAGWALNIVLFGLTIYLTGHIIAQIVPTRLVYAYGCALVVLILPSVFRLHTIIAADPLFMVLCLLFFEQATAYLKSNARMHVIWMGLLAVLASLVKYPGLVLAIIGSLVVLMRTWQRGNFRPGLLQGCGFFLFSVLPLTGWVFIHNYWMNNSLFGARGYAEPLGNLYIAIEKLLYWFIPYSLIQRVSVYGWLLLIVVAAIVLVQPASWKDWLRLLRTPELLPLVLFAFFYGLTLLFLVSYSEHSDFRVDRLHIAMLFPVLAFLVSAMETLRPRWNLPLHPSLLHALALLAFLIWTVYPLNNTRKYIARSLAQGETDNNLYNTRVLRESDLVRFLEANPFTPGAVLYSNHEGAAWFFTRHNVLGMPQGDRANEENLDIPAILQAYQGWPPQPGYIVWFDLGFKLHILPPKELSPLAEITEVFKGDPGGVYRVTPR